MSTKKTTDTSNKYDPTSMNAFNTMTPQMQSNLSEFMKDPTQQAGFNLALAQQMKGVQTTGQRTVNNLFANMKAGGFGGGNMNAYQGSMLGMAGRQNSANASNAFTQNYLGFKQNQFQATGMAEGYKPLQTGSTTTETTSGLGTWLPQVAGAALQGAAAFATGGASLAATAAGKAMSGGGGGGLFSGGLQADSNASASNPFLYSQPGQGGYNPFYGYGGN